MNYWEKLESLPCEVLKKSGNYTGNYALRISVNDGTFFLEYIYNGEIFTDFEPTWPERFSGNSFEEVIDKATKFFEDNFGKYEIVKY